MEDKKYTSVQFTAKIEPKEKINSEFTRCKCYAFGVGKNRNYSHVSKETLIRCMNTLAYAPVVGHIINKYDKDGNKVGSFMGSHDYMFTDDWEFKPATVPYGVVVENTFNFETVKEYKDNSEREYLTCDVILWTGRYPELLDCLYSDDIYFNESAELNVNEFRPLEEDSNYTDLTDIEFSALCLLGKADKNSTNGHTDEEEHTEPCFIEAKVIPKEFSFDNEEFTKVMSELKTELAFYFNKPTENRGKEEKMARTKKDTNVEAVNMEAEVSTTEETVEEMSTEEPVTEEISETLDETPETNSVGTKEETVEDTEEKFEDDNSDDSDTDDSSDEAANEEVSEEIDEEVSEETNTEETDVVENVPVGASNVDSKTSDDDEEIKKKHSLEDYDALVSEFETYKAEHSHTDEEFNTLLQFKTNTENAQLHSQREAILADEKYAVISEKETNSEGNEVYKNEAFGKLVSEMDNYSLEDLEKEVKSIFADHITAGGQFSLAEKKTVSKKLFGNADKKVKTSGRYGNLFAKDKE